MNRKEMLRAAYTLNVWTVSVSQIIQFRDINILKKEYDCIINNLNLENMPKDDALLDIITEIMDDITFMLSSYGDQKIADMEYTHRIKNAIWSSVPTIGGIFASGHPAAIALSLATQVGISFMNYFRIKSEIELNYDKTKWEIEKEKILRLEGLRKELFKTAWRLADKYNFPDEYRLSDKQITEYNAALIESNDTSRFIKLNRMKDSFKAYPPFWYQLGSAANRLYQNKKLSFDTLKMYQQEAISAFEYYRQMNQFSILRNDYITAAWAMEYLEFLNLSSINDPSKGMELIKIAEKNAGNALDILEICAFDYLRMGAYIKAEKLFLHLVNEQYNSDINTQVLSWLYITWMRSNDRARVEYAKIWYPQLKNITNEKYIIPIPDENVDINYLEQKWIGLEEHDKRIRSMRTKEKARPFYEKSFQLIVDDGYSLPFAERFASIIMHYREIIDPQIKYEVKAMTEYNFKKNKMDNERIFGECMHRIRFTYYSNDNVRKNNKENGWDFDRLGIKIKTTGIETLIFVKNCKPTEKEEYKKMEEMVLKKYRFYDSEFYKSLSVNKAKWFTRFAVGFYKYLETNNAIVR